MNNKCPGQDSKNLKVEILACPNCGYKIEMFSDEVKVTCPQCKNLVCRQRLPTCIDWCKSAKLCAGEQFYNKYMQNKQKD